MKERWVSTSTAMQELGINYNVLSQRIWYERHKNKNEKCFRKRDKVLEIEINYFSGTSRKMATEERRKEVYDLYYKCLEKFNDDEGILIRKATEHSKVSYDCMRQRILDFTFSTKRVCDEMEQVFKSILKEQA